LLTNIKTSAPISTVIQIVRKPVVAVRVENRLDTEAIVDTQLDKVYEFILKPSNLLQVWPSLIEVTKEKIMSNGGYSFQWKYKMSGMHFDGSAEHTEIIPNQYLVCKTRGAIESTMWWTFRSIDRTTTRVTCSVEYHVPIPLLGRLAEVLIVKMNEQEAGITMTNLQRHFEIKTASA